MRMLAKVPLVFLLAVSLTPFVSAADCARHAKKAILDLWSSHSLSSPDNQWTFISMGPKSSDKVARLYFENRKSHQKWEVGSIERDAMVLWSSDGRRLLLVDEYAADDTKIRIFDVTGGTPKEVTGVDEKIRAAIFSYISAEETTFWLIYPQACFAASGSSTVLLSADAPRVPKVGTGAGKDLKVKLALDLDTLTVRELEVRKEP